MSVVSVVSSMSRCHCKRPRVDGGGKKLLRPHHQPTNQPRGGSTFFRQQLESSIRETLFLTLEDQEQEQGNGYNSDYTPMSKEATVFVIDVGPSMALTKQPDSKATRLDTAQAAFQKLLQKKLLTGRKMDQVGMIFFGTDDTRNDLAEGGRYENIVAARPIAMADISLLKMPFPKGNENGDVLDALIVALDMIVKHCRHLKYEKKIILITDAEGSINQADLDNFGAAMMDKNCQLTVMGLDFDDPEYGLTQARKPATKRASEAFFTKTSRNGGRQHSAHGRSHPIVGHSSTKNRKTSSNIQRSFDHW